MGRDAPRSGAEDCPPQADLHRAAPARVHPARETDLSMAAWSSSGPLVLALIGLSSLSRGAPPPLADASHATRSRACVLAWPRRSSLSRGAPPSLIAAGD